MKKLPIGIQDFPTLIQRGFLYVDKTPLLFKMINEEQAYFFARPRRFGKSLLVSTLAAIFKGDKKLFEGTWIANAEYNWAPHPVISLDFSNLASTSPEEMLQSLNSYLQEVGTELGVQMATKKRPSETLSHLVSELDGEQGIVLLIDEYDRPLVKHLEDGPLTEANRKALQDFFTVIKSLQGKLRFVFITGVSKFSKVSLFSGMNSLSDLSLRAEYATLVGLTESEIRSNFSAFIEQTGRKRGQTTEQVLSEMQSWYNGYLFSRSPDAERVFNPWSVLNFLNTSERDNYWFSTGTPTFAIDLIKSRNFPLVNFEAGVAAGEEIESNHIVESIDLISLLFQTGYLTIDSYDEAADLYQLRLPNEEVRKSLLNHLFRSFSDQEDWKTRPLLQELRQHLEQNELDLFFKTFNQLIAGIPYPLHTPAESYYHSLIYLCLRMLGFQADAEVLTNRGRIDLVVSTDAATFIFEFKIDGTAESAIEQIRMLNYAQKYEATDKSIHLVGVNFDTKTRQVADWKSELLRK